MSRILHHQAGGTGGTNDAPEDLAAELGLLHKSDVVLPNPAISADILTVITKVHHLGLDTAVGFSLHSDRENAVLTLTTAPENFEQIQAILSFAKKGCYKLVSNKPIQQRLFE